MRKLILPLALAFFVASCGEANHEEKPQEEATEHEAHAEQETETEEVTYPYVAGAEFDASKAVGPAELLAQLESFDGDTLYTTLSTNINECCKAKGCWMTLDMGESDQEMMVRFKDYEFFVPLNADGHETVVSGKVFRDTISVDELKHYAEDAGADADSIAKITEPKVKLAFEASGVLVK